MNRLENKVILVTGSTTGIGKAIAIRCVAEGAKVILHGLELDRVQGEVLRQEIGEDRCALVIENLANSSAAEVLVAATLRAFGQIHAVVNNAARVGTGNIGDSDAALFHEMLNINCVVPYLLTRAALPHLTATRGCVLNIGSVNAYSGEPNLLPYSVSKGALMTLTRNLGDTLLRENGVRVNQINPGWVLTENEAKRKREHGLIGDWEKALPAVYAPTGRILRGEEIAAAAVYLIADESGPISGQVLDIEQYPFIGRNPPKDGESLPMK